MTVWVRRGREKTLELNLGMHAETLQGEISVERSSRFVHVHVHVHVRCGVYQMCVLRTYSTQFSSPPLVAAHLAESK